MRVPSVRLSPRSAPRRRDYCTFYVRLITYYQIADLNNSLIYHTKMKLEELFFNESLRYWHFEDLVRESNLSRERVHHFLKALLKERLILRVKPKRKMPYYVANRDSTAFREKKRLLGLQKLMNAGLFEYICSISEIKTAIIFGSFSRGDWNTSSDIDIFIYGDARNFDKRKFELKLHHDIQLFHFDNPRDIERELEPALIPNIIKGFNIKGCIEPFEVIIHA